MKNMKNNYQYLPQIECAEVSGTQDDIKHTTEAMKAENGGQTLVQCMSSGFSTRVFIPGKLYD